MAAETSDSPLVPDSPEKDGLDLDALKALAEKATPGPWWQNAEWPGDVEAASHCIVDDSKEEADAAFIAAFNPQTSLSLVAELTWYREHHVEQECEMMRLRSELAALRESRGDVRDRIARFVHSSTSDCWTNCCVAADHIISAGLAPGMDDYDTDTIFAALICAQAGPEWTARFRALAPKYDLSEKRRAESPAYIMGDPTPDHPGKPRESRALNDGENGGG